GYGQVAARYLRPSEDVYDRLYPQRILRAEPPVHRGGAEGSHQGSAGCRAGYSHRTHDHHYGVAQRRGVVNMTRMNGVDGTDAHSLTAGEIEGRRQIPDIQRYLTEYVPGFENCYFTKAAPFLGIRETRRIVGHYVMDRDDVLNQRRFDDAIAVASYPIDIHRPKDAGCTLEWSGDCYDIPYRSLVPLEIDNLLVAGRCISTTHEAMAAIRVMATCMAMGEAAGRAAAMCSKQGIRPEDVDVSALREQLLAKGAYLRPPAESAQTQETAVGASA